MALISSSRILCSFLIFLSCSSASAAIRCNEVFEKFTYEIFFDGQRISLDKSFNPRSSSLPPELKELSIPEVKLSEKGLEVKESKGLEFFNSLEPGAKGDVIYISRKSYEEWVDANPILEPLLGKARKPGEDMKRVLKMIGEGILLKTPLVKKWAGKRIERRYQEFRNKIITEAKQTDYYRIPTWFFKLMLAYRGILRPSQVVEYVADYHYWLRSQGLKQGVYDYTRLSELKSMPFSPMTLLSAKKFFRAGGRITLSNYRGMERGGGRSHQVYHGVEGKTFSDSIKSSGLVGGLFNPNRGTILVNLYDINAVIKYIENMRSIKDSNIKAYSEPAKRIDEVLAHELTHWLVGSREILWSKFIEAAGGPVENPSMSQFLNRILDEYGAKRATTVEIMQSINEAPVVLLNSMILNYWSLGKSPLELMPLIESLYQHPLKGNRRSKVEDLLKRNEKGELPTLITAVELVGVLNKVDGFPFSRANKEFILLSFDVGIIYRVFDESLAHRINKQPIPVEAYGYATSKVVDFVNKEMMSQWQSYFKNPKSIEDLLLQHAE